MKASQARLARMGWRLDGSSEGSLSVTKDRLKELSLIALHYLGQRIRKPEDKAGAESETASLMCRCWSGTSSRPAINHASRVQSCWGILPPRVTLGQRKRAQARARERARA